MLIENKNNLKGTWRIINQLIDKKKQNHTFSISVNGSVITDKVSIASHFNSYFTSVADNLLKIIEKIPTRI